MSNSVVALFPGSDSPVDVDQALVDFISIGVFHACALRKSISEGELFDDLRNMRQDADQVMAIGNGWGIIADLQTVAVRTMLRIAAVTDSRTIPYEDIAQAIIKMIVWGPDVDDAALRKEFGKRWSEYFEMMPSRAVVKALAAFIGATDKGAGIDFSTSTHVIEPTEIEVDVLEALLSQYDHCAPTSRLCRLIPGNKSRTHVDYNVLKGIPFVLKPDREVNRLIGYQRNALLAANELKDSYVSMYKSVDGARVVLQYVVSEQNVEGNSFNVPACAREIIDGTYACKGMKGSVAFNMNGKDARKITGVGKFIRTIYPNYVEGQKLFILLDRLEWVANIAICDADDAATEISLHSWVDETNIQRAG